MWRDWCYRLGLWLARHGGWSEEPLIRPHVRQIAVLRDEITAKAGKIGVLQAQMNGLMARMATTATVSQPVLDRARELTQDADTTLSGGEAKRHAVYAKLIKDFPLTLKRELALAIELALFHAIKEG